MSEHFHHYINEGAPAVLAVDKALDRVIDEGNTGDTMIGRLADLRDAAMQHPEIDEDVLFYVLNNKFKEMEEQ